MRILFRTIIALLVFSPLVPTVGAGAAEKGMTVRGVRHASYAAFTRIVFEVETAAPYVLLRSTDGRSVTLSPYEGPFQIKTTLPAVHDGVVTGLELREEAGRTSVVVRLGAAAGDVKDFALRGPDRIVIDITRGEAPLQTPAAGAQTVIALDPGHGGKDTGIVTAKGQEKTLMLDLAFEIRNMLQKNPRLNVVLTRDKDQALTGDERAAVSNAAGARLLVALHAAPGAVSRVLIQELLDGPGTQSASPVSGDFLGYEAGSEQREMLWDTQQAAHTKESGTLGRKLARQLTGQDSAEPLQSPLVLLKAVDAAAVMIEIGVETDRARTVEAIARGIEHYAGGN